MPVRLVIVDDSSFIQLALKRIFQTEKEIEVVGVASSGEELLENLDVWAPDIITLDLDMPGMGGMKALERLKELRPVPVIILSTHSARNAPLTIEALYKGAVDFIDKKEYSLVDFESLRGVLTGKILAVSGLQTFHPDEEVGPALEDTGKTGEAGVDVGASDFDILLVGASTGGPPAVEKILKTFRGDVPVPILIAQHMPRGFTGAFARRLNANLPITVTEAEDGVILKPGHAYVMPAGLHATVVNRREPAVRLSKEPADLIHCPSINLLFSSAAELMRNRVIAVLLTGMGKDGASGMRQIKEAGGFTIAQDKDSSAVHGMPGAACAAGGVCEIVPLGEIGSRIIHLLVRGQARASGNS